MENNKKTQRQEQNESAVQIKELYYIFIANWYWFVISVAMALGIACFYVLKTQPVYTRNAKVLVKADQKGKSASSDIAAFQDLGLVGISLNVNNELKTMQSIDNMYDVVRNLHLDMNYTTDGLLRDKILYDKTLPIKVEMENVEDEAKFSFDVDLKGETVVLSSFEQRGEKLKGRLKLSLNQTVVTPVGNMCIKTTEFFSPKQEYPTIHVSRKSIDGTARAYAAKLSITLAEKQTDVIAISMNDNNIRRAEDVIDMLIAVYNGNWIKDKNQITVSTSMFIDDRLQVIEQELGNVDSDISTYKSDNLLPDVSAVSSMYLTQNSQTNAKIIELTNQLSVMRFMRNFLASDKNADQLLPVNSGINNSFIEQQISSYNTMMLRRNSLVASSSTRNSLVIDLDAKLAALKNGIISSVDNQILTLKAELESYVSNEMRINARLAANPKQAKYLLSVERQQKVKEALYLFLLQKREENELSQAFTAYNTRIIEHPNGGNAPTKPRRSVIALVALLIGLAIPAAILYLTEMLNTTVQTRKDLDKLTVPFLGEIPIAYSEKEMKQKIEEFKKKRKEMKGREDKDQEGFGNAIVVKQESRNVINEAFRVLRTNLEFVAKDSDSSVIMITSFNPGSGKSFIAMNLALTMAIKKKRILVIDGDLRHASLSTYIFSPKKGISNYLAHQHDDIHELIVPSQEYPTLSYLPVGAIPPNPTELLEDERLNQMIETLRKEYDYIIIDCPPVDMVADTQIINKYADRTLFVIRAGLMDRSLISEVEDMYQQHRFNNMSVILNGTTGGSGAYGGYRYGYRYGYHNYGYHSYGYHANSYYHNDDDEKKD